MQNMENRQDKLQEQYGPAPQAFVDGVLSTLQMIEEDKPVKRFTIRTVLAMALILALMTGVALAIGGGLGVLNIIERDVPISDAAKREIETEFVQQGGELEHMTARVRDAVSDGKTLFVSVEVKTKNPDDAILVTTDGFDWSNEAMRTQRLNMRESGTLPDWERLSEATNIYYVYPLRGIAITGGGLTEDAYLPGLNWRYEGLDTVVFTTLIDLTLLPYPEEPLTAELTVQMAEPDVDAEVKENTPAIYTSFTRTEDTKLAAEIRAGKMEVQKAVAEVPFTYTDFEITELVVEVSPLATYITITRNIPEEYADQRTAYYVYCDEEGKEYQEIAMLSAVNVRSNEDGNWDGVPLTWTYDHRGELPANIILRAVGFDDRDKSVPLPEDLVVPLIEVTEP